MEHIWGGPSDVSGASVGAGEEGVGARGVGEEVSPADFTKEMVSFLPIPSVKEIS
jgi:hypothetical protein